MHDVGVVLDIHLIGDPDRAHLGHPADVVAPQIEEHQVLGQLLGIGQQILGQGFVLGRVLAAPAGPGEGADGYLAGAHANQYLRARADH